MSREFRLAAAMFLEPAKIVGQLPDGGTMVGGFHVYSIEFRDSSFKFRLIRKIEALRLWGDTSGTKRRCSAHIGLPIDGEGFKRHAEGLLCE